MFSINTFKRIKRFIFSNNSEKTENIAWNQRERDASTESIESDTAYAMKIGIQYLSLLNALETPILGKKIVELGPGHNYGSVAILACLGADVAVADRFNVPWSNNYHGKFYKRLAELVKLEWPGVATTPIDDIVHANRHDVTVTELRSSAEDLHGISSDCFDIVFSNAVLEHLFNPKAALESLYRITAPGGIGLHQVDFRDHRDFEKPLEYLLLPEEEFNTMFHEQHCECGNQTRPSEMLSYFRSAGFDVLKYKPNMFADSPYLNDFMPRLRACSSRYAKTQEGELEVVSAHFVVRRPANVPKKEIL